MTTYVLHTKKHAHKWREKEKKKTEQKTILTI